MDTDLLSKIIKNQGLNISKISMLTKMSHNNLSNKLKGDREFKASELAKIKKALCLSHESMAMIIFGPEKSSNLTSRFPSSLEWRYFRDNELDYQDWLIQKVTPDLIQIVHRQTGEQRVIAK